MLRHLFGFRAGPRAHAVPVSAQAALEAREDYFAPRSNYGTLDLRDLAQLNAPSYGRIPYGINDAKLPFERIAYGFCPSCGAPRKHELCEYCGTRHRLNELEFRRKAALNSDDSCPRCGDALDTVNLHGDNVTIATHVYCTSCGYQGGA